MFCFFFLFRLSLAVCWRWTHRNNRYVQHSLSLSLLFIFVVFRVCVCLCPPHLCLCVCITCWAWWLLFMRTIFFHLSPPLLSTLLINDSNGVWKACDVNYGARIIDVLYDILLIKTFPFLYGDFPLFFFFLNLFWQNYVYTTKEPPTPQPPSSLLPCYYNTRHRYRPYRLYKRSSIYTLDWDVDRFIYRPSLYIDVCI